MPAADAIHPGLFSPPPVTDRASTALGALYLGAAQAFRVAAGVLSTLVLARYLTPADFGLVAMVSPFLLLLALVQDLGMGQAMVQRQSVEAGQANLMFWATVGMGMILSAVMAATAPFAASFYGRPELRDLVAAFSIVPAITSVGTIHAAVLNRRMRFGAIALTESVGVASGLLAAFSGVVYGLGYWSVFISALVTSLVTQVGVLAACGWIPGLPGLGQDFRAIARFGMGMSAANFLNFAHRNVDNVILARCLGAADLGIYDRAYKLMLMPIQQILGPLGRIMMPYLSARASRPDDYRAAYMLCATCIMIIAHPSLLVASLASRDVATTLLGSNWTEVGNVFRWLGLCGIQQVLTSSFGWLLASQGRARDSTRIAAVGLACATGAVLAGLPWGIQGVALAYAAMDTLIRAPCHVALTCKCGPVTVRDILVLCLPHVFALVVSAACLTAIGVSRGGLPWPHLILAVAVAQASYTAVLAAFPSKRRILAKALEPMTRVILRPRRTIV